MNSPRKRARLGDWSRWSDPDLAGELRYCFEDRPWNTPFMDELAREAAKRLDGVGPSEPRAADVELLARWQDVVHLYRNGHVRAARDLADAHGLPNPDEKLDRRTR